MKTIAFAATLLALTSLASEPVTWRFASDPAGWQPRAKSIALTRVAATREGSAGMGYWEYGVEYMLKFMDLARTRLGVNLYDHDWWRNTARYGQYLSLPRSAWTRGNCIVDIADCPRGHWHGPDYLLRGLASEFRDEHAQWLAQQIDDADVPSAGAPWLKKRKGADHRRCLEVLVE